MSAVDDLKKLYRQGRLVPFIGAGVSMAVTWKEGTEEKRGPSWAELVEQAAVLLGFHRPELLMARGNHLQVLEYFRIKMEGFAPLTNWLYAHMRPPDEAIRGSVIHRELTSMENCRVYYTTNYDDFLERSLQIGDRSPQVIAVESHMGSHDDRCEVVKFHGDFNHPTWMVLSESDFNKRLAFETPMDLRFRSDLLGRAVLFLGYSFTDLNVSYLFHLVNKQLQALPSSATGRRAYIVVPDPSDFEIVLFRARNMEVIPVRAKRISEDIALLLSEIRG
jgi:SIR2-like domain